MPKQIKVNTSRTMPIAEYLQYMASQGEYQLTDIKHPDLNKRPLPKTRRLSRYITYPEFLQLLNGSLKFTSVNKLREHDYKEFLLQKQQIDENAPEFKTLTADELEATRRLLEEKNWAKHWFVSCWTTETIENMAFWKIFGSGGTGILIESTAAQITESLADPPDYRFYKKRVRYSSDDIRANVNAALFTKSMEFRYESEARICFQVQYHYEDDYIFQRIYPEKLINRITLGPGIPWAYSDATNLVQKFGLDPDIVRKSSYGK